MSTNDRIPMGLSPERVPAHVTTIRYFRATGGDETSRSSTQLGLFLNRNIALVAVRGKGGWGGDGSVEDVVQLVVIYRDDQGRQVTRAVGAEMEQLKFVDSDPRIAAALSKLDEGDLAALGALGMFK